MRTQKTYQPDREDWLFHVLVPLAAYTLLFVSAFATRSHAHEALFGVGAAALFLLFIGIHNVWDTSSTTYLSTKGQERLSGAERMCMD